MCGKEEGGVGVDRYKVGEKIAEFSLNVLVLWVNIVCWIYYFRGRILDGLRRNIYCLKEIIFEVIMIYSVFKVNG